MKQYSLAIGLSFLMLGLTGCGAGSNDSFDESFRVPISAVWFGDDAEVLTVYYADIAAEQTVGLGRVEQLGEKEGMLFSYVTAPAQPTFWMKDVDYPLDIIWVSHGNIIGITPNVQPEAAATDLAEYTLYPAPAEVDWVIEVPAGYAQTHGLELGDPFYYSLPE